MVDLYRYAVEAGQKQIAEGQEGGESKPKNWFEALAKAQGLMLANRIGRIVDLQAKMQEHFDASLDPKANKEGAKQFMDAQTQYQAQIQMFGQDTQIANNSIKTIGESLSTLSRATK